VAVLIPLMQEWKKAGRIRYVGVTTSRVSQHAEIIDVMRNYPLDFIQVDYSIATARRPRRFFPLALERKLAVLANLPFGRSSLFRQAADRELPSWAADIGRSDLGAILPQVCDLASGGDLRHTGLNKGEPLGGQSGRRPRQASGRAMRRKMEGTGTAGHETN